MTMLQREPLSAGPRHSCIRISTTNRSGLTRTMCSTGRAGGCGRQGCCSAGLRAIMRTTLRCGGGLSRARRIRRLFGIIRYGSRCWGWRNGERGECCIDINTIRDVARELWFRGLVIEADGAGDLPSAVFVVPERDELCFAAVLRIAGVVKAVNADLDCAVVVKRVDLERAGYECALHVTGA